MSLKNLKFTPKVLYFSSAYTKCGHRLVLLKLVCRYISGFQYIGCLGYSFETVILYIFFPVFLLPLPGRKNLQNQIQYRIWQALPVKPIFRSTLPRRERQDISITLCSASYFNPRSREGSDSNISQVLKFIL